MATKSHPRCPACGRPALPLDDSRHMCSGCKTPILNRDLPQLKATESVSATVFGSSASFLVRGKTTSIQLVPA